MTLAQVAKNVRPLLRFERDAVLAVKAGGNKTNALGCVCRENAFLHGNMLPPPRPDGKSR